MGLPSTQGGLLPGRGQEQCRKIEETSFWFNHRNDVIASVVLRFSPRDTLFDIGGGNGYVSLGLQRAGVSSVVVEPGPCGARNALERGISAVIQSTLEDAGFRSGSMGAAGLFDVLEHVEDDSAFLREIHRCLRPGGCLFVTVPAFPALWSAEDDAAGHFRRYSLASLERTLQAAGFIVRYRSYFFSILVLPVILLRTLPYRVGLRKGFSLETVEKEHAAGSGRFGTILDAALKLELAWIRHGRRLPAGTSCLPVAARPAPGRSCHDSAA